MTDTLYNLKHGYITVANASTTTADATDLNLLDGITNGTAIASKVMITDANVDIGGLRNVTATGAIQAATITATTRFIGKTTTPFLAVTADGAISIPLYDCVFFFTKAGIVAATLADPTATTHDGVTLTFVSTTTDANTLSNAAGSGFNGGGGAADIATWGAAIGNNMTIVAYQGVWYIVGTMKGVTLG